MTAPGIYRRQLAFEAKFTQIPNRWLRDKRIGFRAKGLLAYLFSHEVGYIITIGQIERETGDGKSAIRSAIDELTEAGYLNTKRTHDERGYNAGLAWYLSDPNPESENPTLENPTLENRTALRTQLIENTNVKELYAQNEFEPVSDFDKFWAMYPRKNGKASALKAFIKAIEKGAGDEVIEGAFRLSRDPNLPAKQFIPYPATWLNEERWNDEPYPERIETNEERLDRLAAVSREKTGRDKEATANLLAEQEKDLEDAAPPPTCIHGNTLLKCITCIRSLPH